MMKVMYNDQLVYTNKVVIWVFLGVILWKEKEALSKYCRFHVQLNIKRKTKVCILGTIFLISVDWHLHTENTFVVIFQPTESEFEHRYKLHFISYCGVYHQDFWVIHPYMIYSGVSP